MPSLPSAPWAGQLPTEPAPWTLSLPPDIFSRGSPLPSGGAMRASGSIAIQPSHPIWMGSPDFAIPFVSCFACFCSIFFFFFSTPWRAPRPLAGPRPAPYIGPGRPGRPFPCGHARMRKISCQEAAPRAQGRPAASHASKYVRTYNSQSIWGVAVIL